jgi:hypothetical protein
MNNQEKYNDDPLRHYINPEMIEKAPEDFTSKVMARIELEKVSSLSAPRSRKINLVPVVSITVIILLLAVVFTIPVTKDDPLTMTVINFLNNIKSWVPDVNLTGLSKISLPSVLIYILIGILVLTFFDRALYSIFHREKSN